MNPPMHNWIKSLPSKLDIECFGISGEENAARFKEHYLDKWDPLSKLQESRANLAVKITELTKIYNKWWPGISKDLRASFQPYDQLPSYRVQKEQDRDAKMVDKLQSGSRKRRRNSMENASESLTLEMLQCSEPARGHQMNQIAQKVYFKWDEFCVNAE
eukprot:751493_1